MQKIGIVLAFSLASFLLGRLGVIAAFFELDEKSFLLALFLENAQGLFETVLI
jgi:hypothetical protein